MYKGHHEKLLSFVYRLSGVFFCECCAYLYILWNTNAATVNSALEERSIKGAADKSSPMAFDGSSSAIQTLL